MADLPGAQFLGLLFTGLTLYTPVVVYAVRVGGRAERANEGVSRIEAERERDKITWGRRLEKAEEVAADLKVLAESVKALGSLMEREAARQDERHAELKEDILHAKNNAAMAKEMASRRRTREGD